MRRKLSDVEVRDLERVRLNEFAARLDDIAHQGREQAAGFLGVVDLDLKQRPAGWIEGRFP